MATSRSLLETISDQATPVVLDRAATCLGETPEAIAKGLSGAAATALLALAHRSTESGAAAGVHQLATGPARDHAGADLVNAWAEETTAGSNLAVAAFGDRIEAVTLALAEHAGLKGRSSAAILNLASTLVYAALGRDARESGFDAKGLGAKLLGAREAFLAAAPAPLQRSLGLGAPRAAIAADAGGSLAAVALLVLLLSALWWATNNFRPMAATPVERPVTAERPAPTESDPSH
jgi:hypothetical protein